MAAEPPDNLDKWPALLGRDHRPTDWVTDPDGGAHWQIFNPKTGRYARYDPPRGVWYDDKGQACGDAYSMPPPPAATAQLSLKDIGGTFYDPSGPAGVDPSKGALNPPDNLDKWQPLPPRSDYERSPDPNWVANPDSTARWQIYNRKTGRYANFNHSNGRWYDDTGQVCGDGYTMPPPPPPTSQLTLKDIEGTFYQAGEKPVPFSKLLFGDRDPSGSGVIDPSQLDTSPPQFGETSQPPDTNKLDTGHYDDGHAFDWSNSPAPVAEIDGDTGHYDDGHAFGWGGSTSAPSTDVASSDETGAKTSRRTAVYLGGAVALLVLGGVGAALALSGGSGSKTTTSSSVSAGTGLTRQGSSPVADAGTAVTPLGLRPIQAVFTQAQFSTVYTEAVSDPNWTFTWTLKMGSDDSCAEGFSPNTPGHNQAIWKHADVSEGGACHHGGSDYDPTTIGHPGIITLTVVDSRRPHEQCVLTFRGSAPLNQDPASPAQGGPEECIRR